jgi:hypothetical protein
MFCVVEEPWKETWTSYHPKIASWRGLQDRKILALQEATDYRVCRIWKHEQYLTKFAFNSCLNDANYSSHRDNRRYPPWNATQHEDSYPLRRNKQFLISPLFKQLHSESTRGLIIFSLTRNIKIKMQKYYIYPFVYICMNVKAHLRLSENKGLKHISWA